MAPPTLGSLSTQQSQSPSQSVNKKKEKLDKKNKYLYQKKHDDQDQFMKSDTQLVL